VRVLVTGAAGFLGGAVVRACRRAGDRARGLVRSPSQAELLRAEGGVPVVGDVLVPETLGRAVEGCDVVVHLAQARGGDAEAARAVRVRGLTNVLAACRDAGVERILIGSGYWVYLEHDGVITEESPVRPIGLAAVNHEAERVARAAEDTGEFEVVVVRPGMVYGQGSWFGEMVDELRSGKYAYVGDGANRLSPVALEDAGDAFRLVLDRWRPGRTYLVVDDEPVTTREFAGFVADQLGVARPSGLSMERAAQLWGRELAQLNAADRPASNAALRALGWTPRHPSFRDGVPPLLRSMQGRTR
jgi:2-alkyl-3-oxoalkanoate reductase